MRGIAFLFALASVCGPLALGATWPWPRFALEAVMGLGIIVWAIVARPPVRLLLVPALAFGICLFQTIPLPDSLLMRLAPISAGAWKIANASAPGTWGSISVDPGATLAGARRLLLGLATVFVIADVARDRFNRRVLITGIAISAAVMMLLAAGIRSSKEDRLILGFIDLSGPIDFWKTPVDPPVQTAGFSETDWVVVGDRRYVSDSWVVGDRIGPYIVSNQYAGGVCLTLPILLACVLAVSARLGTVVSVLASLAIAAVGIWTVAVVAQSRAGTVSLLFALAMLAWLAAGPRMLRRALVVVTCLLASVIVGGALALHGPLSDLGSYAPESLRPAITTLLTDGRVLASQLAGRMFAASPIFGTGLGSYYELAGRMLGGAPPWGFAHNEYAQWLAETGLVGGLFAVVGLAGLVRLGATFAGGTPTAEKTLLAGSWAAVAGIAAHSFFDWNLHVPANAFLALVATGLAISSARSATGDTTASPRVGWFRPAAAIAFAMAVGIALILLARDAWSATVERDMRTALAEVRLAAAYPKRPSPEQAVQEAIDSGNKAVRWDASNARLWLLLGQLKIHAATLRPADAGSLRQDAASCLDKAQRRSAVVRGLPEPLPVSPVKR
jgi:hypothetical protein